MKEGPAVESASINGVCSVPPAWSHGLGEVVEPLRTLDKFMTQARCTLPGLPIYSHRRARASLTSDGLRCITRLMGDPVAY
jgi:hypothetical protein